MRLFPVLFAIACGPATYTPYAPLEAPPDQQTVDPTDPTDPGSTSETTTAAGPTFDGGIGVFEGEHEGRGYSLYVPTTYDPAIPSAIVVGFHGAGDNGPSFFAQSEFNGFFDAAEDTAALLLVPDSDSPYSDWANWSGNPMNDFGTMEAEFAEIEDMVDALGEHWHLDPDAFHAFGFSNGGLFVAVGGFAAADRLSTATILGYGWGSAYIVSPSRALPVQMATGSSDSFVGYADQTASFLQSQGHDTRYERVSGVGHSFSGLTAVVPPESLVDWMLDRPAP